MNDNEKGAQPRVASDHRVKYERTVKVRMKELQLGTCDWGDRWSVLNSKFKKKFQINSRMTTLN
jgi:hypothetical protein